jgi:hypothetical protein
MIRAADGDVVLFGVAVLLVVSALICLVLGIVLVGMRDKSDEEVFNILCSYERRAHEAWDLSGEVGDEPSLRECE